MSTSLKNKLIINIPITSENPFLDLNLGSLQLECWDDWQIDTGSFAIRLVSQKNKNSSVIKGSTDDGYRYDDIYLCDQDGKRITELQLFIENKEPKLEKETKQ